MTELYVSCCDYVYFWQLEVERREAEARAMRLKQEEEERRRLQEAAMLKKQQEEAERRRQEEADRRRKEQEELKKVCSCYSSQYKGDALIWALLNFWIFFF